jgi:hypothetical protein
VTPVDRSEAIRVVPLYRPNDRTANRQLAYRHVNSGSLNEVTATRVKM